SDSKGNLLSLPFNSSTPVFYVNKDAYRKAGLDADKPPKTWKEFAAAAGKLKASGQGCVYSTGWPAWVHVENFSAWHNLPIGTQENGIAGVDAEFKVNSPAHVKHVEMLADFAKKGWFTYSGRRNEAEARFFSGECAMLTSSSGAQANIRRNAKFDFSVNFLPYNDEIASAPQNAVTLVFVFWPAAPAGWYSFQLQDAFGLRVEFAGLSNFAALFRDANYLHSFQVTALFSALVAVSGIAVALLLAVMADRVVRGALAYKTLLIWPYAVAPAVAGVLWAFLFAPSVGIVTYALRQAGYDWNWVLRGEQAMLLVVIASAWKQVSYNFLFFLAGLQSIPRSLIEAAAIDGAGPARRFWTVVFPLLSPTTFFLLVVNVVYAFFDTFGVIDATTQ